MAGSGATSGFDATEFREAIHFAMTMGMPNKASEKATFQWPVRREYVAPDMNNRPYNWTQNALVEDERPDVQVLCAVEFSGSADYEGTAVGRFERARAVITLLDVDYAQVEGATRVLLGGDKYEIVFVAPPIGLFDVTVYQVHCQAIDES